MFNEIDNTKNILYTKNISYDDGHVKRTELKLLDSVLVSSDYEYNDDDALASEHITVGNNEQVYNYSYTDGYTKRLNSVSLNDETAESVEYDSLGRVKKLINSGSLCTTMNPVNPSLYLFIFNVVLYKFCSSITTND